MTPEHIEYQRGLAMRVFDAFGSSGFNVDEDGRLWYFGPGGPWNASDGDWIIRNADGSLSVRQGIPLEWMTEDERFRLLYPGPPMENEGLSTEQELLDLVFPPAPSPTSAPPGECRTEQDYHEAKVALERIIQTAQPGTPEGDEFVHLSVLIKDWERRNGAQREGL